MNSLGQGPTDPILGNLGLTPPHPQVANPICTLMTTSCATAIAADKITVVRPMSYCRQAWWKVVRQILLFPSMFLLVFFGCIQALTGMGRDLDTNICVHCAPLIIALHLLEAPKFLPPNQM